MPLSKILFFIGISTAWLVRGVQAAPAPQVPGYSDANFPISQVRPQGSVATSFGPDSIVSAIATSPPTGTEPGAAPPLIKSILTGPTSHGPFSGTPTTT